MRDSPQRADATTSVEVLTRHFAQHGPPLVLKSDNGKALTAGGVPAHLAAHEVTPLVSPVFRPQYNGSCEAGAKAMKVRSEDMALIHDRSCHWTSEDLASALRIANEFHRSGPHTLGRSERWQQRTPIKSAERGRFLAALGACRARLTAAQTPPHTPQHTRNLERRSVAQTLVEQGLLVIHRMSNTSPIKRRKRTE